MRTFLYTLTLAAATLLLATTPAPADRREKSAPPGASDARSAGRPPRRPAPMNVKKARGIVTYKEMVKLVTADMLFIPVSETPFIRGTPNGRPDERPVKEIYVGPFYIDPFETTNAQYEECVKDGGCTPASRYEGFTKPDLPVVGVNWFQARQYCRWAGKRLPTEAEWEKAARGLRRRKYPWGDTWQPAYANWRDDDGGDGEEKEGKGIDGYAGTAPVGSYEKGKSAYGAYDMSGNVAEWVLDWYKRNYYAVGNTHKPRGPSTGDLKVLRGGSWFSRHDLRRGELRTTSRTPLNPYTARAYIGLRCAFVKGEPPDLGGDPEPESKKQG